MSRRHGPFVKRLLTSALLAISIMSCSQGGTSRGTDSGSSAPEKFSSPGGDRKTSSYLIETVLGAPEEYSNTSNFEITVIKRNEDSLVRWKVTNEGKIKCLTDTEWSDPSDQNNILIDSSALVDGEAWLCLMAESLDGVEDSNPIIIQWLHDITPPDAPSTFSIVSPDSLTSQSRTVTFNWIPGQDVDAENGAPASLLKEHLIMVGTTDGGSDVMTSSFGLTDISATITLPRDGDFYFAIAAIDNAGNISLRKIASRYSFDNTPPPAPSSITWDRASPTNNTNSVTVTWPSVEEDTAVTYEYKVGRYQDGDDLVATTTAATNSFTTSLPAGTYNAYVSIRSRNTLLMESSWENFTNTMAIDTEAPTAAMSNYPTGQIPTNWEIIAAPAPPANNFTEYRYRIVAGDSCSAASPLWSDWIDAGTATALSLPGPAYQRTLSICMNVRDAAGNSNTSDNYKIVSWNNSAGEDPDFSESTNIQFKYQYSGTAYSYTSNGTEWPHDSSTKEPTPAILSGQTLSSAGTRTRTGVDGTIYTASEITIGNQRNVKVIRENGNKREETILSSVATPDTEGSWCLGNLHLLDLSLDASDSLSDPENDTDSTHMDQFYTLVSCITPDGIQQIRVLSFIETQHDPSVGNWTFSTITDLETTTPGIGALAVNGNILASIADPTDQFKIQTCVNPPVSDGSNSCSLYESQGSRNTTHLAAIITGDGKSRIIAAGTDLGTTRIGVIDNDSTPNDYALRWLIREIPDPASFILSPYIE